LTNGRSIYVTLNIKNIGTESLVINSSNIASKIIESEGTGLSFFSWVESQNTTTCNGLTAGSGCIVSLAYLCNNIVVESVIARAILTLAESSNLKLSSIVNATNYNQVGIWTWIGGTTTTFQAGSYGTTPSINNMPPGMQNQSGTGDGNGNLYMFGGSFSVGALNTLWKYNVATGYWVSLTGNMADTLKTTGTSASKTVEATTNTPSSLASEGMTMDESGYLWVFGGYFSSSYCNNLWRYNPTNTSWAWMTGNAVSCSATLVPPTAPTRGVESAGNIVPSLYELSLTADKHGNLWLFGGYNGTAAYNTMWRYNKTTNLWTWIAGITSTAGTATAGASGVESSGNTPPALYGHGATLDESGNIWVMGGFSVANTQNGLWRFNTNTQMWAWIGGTTYTAVNISAVAGGSGVESASYHPGGIYGFGMWYDKHGYIWAMGGYGVSTTGTTGTLNNLWRYNIATKQWAWISGTPGSVEVADASIGTKGQISSSNLSGGMRPGSASWYYNNYAYVYSGYGDDSAANTARLNTFSRTKLYTN